MESVAKLFMSNLRHKFFEPYNKILFFIFRDFVCCMESGKYDFF